MSVEFKQFLEDRMSFTCCNGASFCSLPVLNSRYESIIAQFSDGRNHAEFEFRIQNGFKFIHPNSP